ncbi:MAG TPA: ergothioneine biosynthesis protein EgtB [Caldimonas sp.]|nr:ergothioneine biosynthesis protein EgtB [Caldimonas sp.]HEX2540588.1 ergothioneine biosynthesis protein EgtB [Caldimonas sp.]
MSGEAFRTNGRTAAARGTLAERYASVRQASHALAAPLSAEDCQVQSMPDASPTKWHLAHITWFFETFVLERYAPSFKPFDPAFRVVFNSYYQGVGEQHPRPRRGLLTRPSLAEVKRYRAHVDDAVQALLEARAGDPEIEALVTLGLHHEQQHQELMLTDIKHALSCSPLAQAYAKRWPMARVGPQALRWFGFPGGLREMGHSPEADGAFCFDNETPRHRAWAEGFEIASRLATYGDFLAFMEDDGYARPELWLSMGWDWVRAQARDAPLYWRRDGDRWVTHTLQGTVAIDPHTPVCHLSYFEADAFARWSGARLPTELEWEIVARSLPGGMSGNFADRGAFHPMPQTAPVGDEPLQMFGDVWEWTQSAYLPYPRYRPLPGAVGEYNGKFMCNQFVLRGGSCATPEGHVRASYRNFFPPEAQWQFSGVRLARDA